MCDPVEWGLHPDWRIQRGIRMLVWKDLRLLTPNLISGAFVTLLCMLAYAAAGMDFFDAAIHAMTTVATGGFSTKDASLGHWGDNTAIQLIAVYGSRNPNGLPFGSSLRYQNWNMHGTPHPIGYQMEPVFFNRAQRLVV